MKKNVQEVFNSWFEARENNKNQTIHTNGQTIFSYKTPILFRTAGEVLLDSNKYSLTTTKQQNSLRELLTARGFKNRETKEKLEIWSN